MNRRYNDDHDWSNLFCIVLTLTAFIVAGCQEPRAMSAGLRTDDPVSFENVGTAGATAAQVPSIAACWNLVNTEEIRNLRDLFKTSTDPVLKDGTAAYDEQSQEFTLHGRPSEESAVFLRWRFVPIETLTSLGVEYHASIVGVSDSAIQKEGFGLTHEEFIATVLLPTLINKLEADMERAKRIMIFLPPTSCSVQPGQVNLTVVESQLPEPLEPTGAIAVRWNGLNKRFHEELRKKNKESDNPTVKYGLFEYDENTMEFSSHARALDGFRTSLKWQIAPIDTATSVGVKYETTIMISWDSATHKQQFFPSPAERSNRTLLLQLKEKLGYIPSPMEVMNRILLPRLIDELQMGVMFTKMYMASSASTASE